MPKPGPLGNAPVIRGGHPVRGAIGGPRAQSFTSTFRIGLVHCIVAHGDEVEDARAEVVELKREHAHAMDEYRHVIADLATRADGAQAELGAAVCDKDGADATVNSLRERIVTLEADLENWGSRSAICRRRVQTGRFKLRTWRCSEKRTVRIYRDSA